MKLLLLLDEWSPCSGLRKFSFICLWLQLAVWPCLTTGRLFWGWIFPHYLLQPRTIDSCCLELFSLGFWDCVLLGYHPALVICHHAPAAQWCLPSYTCPATNTLCICPEQSYLGPPPVSQFLLMSRLFSATLVSFLSLYQAVSMPVGQLSPVVSSLACRSWLSPRTFSMSVQPWNPQSLHYLCHSSVHFDAYSCIATVSYLNYFVDVILRPDWNFCRAEPLSTFAMCT